MWSRSKKTARVLCPASCIARARAHTSRASGDGAADTFDLLEVQEIVPGVQLAEMLQALFPALDMHPHSLQVRQGRALHQAQARPSKHREQRDRVRRVGFVVVQPLRPAVLIVPGQRWSVLREDQAQAPRPDDLGIREMLQDLADRPFAPAFRLAHFPRGHPLARAWEGRWAERLHYAEADPSDAI